jgi:hypothetical protein
MPDQYIQLYVGSSLEISLFLISYLKNGRFFLTRSCAVNVLEGCDSTDLRHYTSTKQKIVNYWFYSIVHKKKKLYLNNI